MLISAPAIICSARLHGETGVIVRALTESHGLLAGYVSGGRSRALRPVLVPGNSVAGEWRERGGAHLASLSVEPLHSRAALIDGPLAAAAIDWLTALAHPYPAFGSRWKACLVRLRLPPQRAAGRRR
jgi:DNA repair protein RecO (recombination protein O)